MSHWIHVYLRGGAPCFRPTEFVSGPHDGAQDAARLAFEVLPLGSSQLGREVMISDDEGRLLVVFTRVNERLEPTLTVFAGEALRTAMSEEMRRFIKGKRLTSRRMEVDPCEGARLTVSSEGRNLEAIASDLSVVVGIIGTLGALPDLPILRAADLPVRPDEEVSDEDRLRAWLVGKDNVLPLTVARFLVGRNTSLRGMSEEVTRLMSGLGWTQVRVSGRKGSLGGGYRWQAPGGAQP